MSLFHRKAAEPILAAVVKKPEPVAVQAEPAETEEEAKAKFASDIWEMELNARDVGHSLIQVLAKAAKDQFGIDIAPADPVPEKD